MAFDGLFIFRTGITIFKTDIESELKIAWNWFGANLPR